MTSKGDLNDSKESVTSRSGTRAFLGEERAVIAWEKIFKGWEEGWYGGSRVSKWRDSRKLRPGALSEPAFWYNCPSAPSTRRGCLWAHRGTRPQTPTQCEKIPWSEMDINLGLKLEMIFLGYHKGGWWDERRMTSQHPRGSGSSVQRGSCRNNQCCYSASYKAIYWPWVLVKGSTANISGCQARRTGNSCSEYLNFLMAFREWFLKATLGVRVAGCVISSTTLFYLVGGKVTGWCFGNLPL